MFKINFKISFAFLSIYFTWKVCGQYVLWLFSNCKLVIFVMAMVRWSLVGNLTLKVMLELLSHWQPWWKETLPAGDFLSWESNYRENLIPISENGKKAVKDPYFPRNYLCKMSLGCEALGQFVCCWINKGFSFFIQIQRLNGN